MIVADFRILIKEGTNHLSYMTDQTLSGISMFLNTVDNKSMPLNITVKTIKYGKHK